MDLSEFVLAELEILTENKNEINWQNVLYYVYYEQSDILDFPFTAIKGRSWYSTRGGPSPLVFDLLHSFLL